MLFLILILGENIARQVLSDFPSFNSCFVPLGRDSTGSTRMVPAILSMVQLGRDAFQLAW